MTDAIAGNADGRVATAGILIDSPTLFHIPAYPTYQQLDGVEPDVDAFVAAYRSDGTVQCFLPLHEWNTLSLADRAVAVAWDGEGLWVAGSFYGSITFDRDKPTEQTLTASPVGIENGYLARYRLAPDVETCTP
jgi:hypothetical protein